VRSYETGLKKVLLKDILQHKTNDKITVHKYFHYCTFIKYIGGTFMSFGFGVCFYFVFNTDQVILRQLVKLVKTCPFLVTLCR